MNKRDSAKILKRNVAIFDFARANGNAAAADKYYQSERNIQRIVSRMDVLNAVRERDAPSWVKAHRTTFDEARRCVIANRATINPRRSPKLDLAHKYLTRAELDELSDVRFSLVYEIALHRHKSKRKHRITGVATKSQRHELTAK